jgi:purine-binding chemotaxis protein CheW
MSEDTKSATQPGAAVQQVLTFALAGETYGVDILKVREIRGWSSVTHIPQAPIDVLGVLNLRGAIVPIIDLRARFGLAAAERTSVTVIIVLTVEKEGRSRDVGLVVDSVSDVVDLSAQDLKAVPELAGRGGDELLLGLASIGENMALLLNTDELISEMQLLAA